MTLRETGRIGVSIFGVEVRAEAELNLSIWRSNLINLGALMFSLGIILALSVFCRRCLIQFEKDSCEGLSKGRKVEMGGIMGMTVFERRSHMGHKYSFIFTS